MNGSHRQATWFRLLLLLLFIVPLAVIFLAPSEAMGGGHVMWFWLMIILSIRLIWMLLGTPHEDGILLAILLPVPHALWGELGIHCPYL